MVKVRGIMWEHTGLKRLFRHRGDCEDHAVTGMYRIVQIFAGLMLFQLWSRGLDYLTGNPDQGNGILNVTDPTPPTVWGLSCVIAATIITLGMLFHRLQLIMFGAVLTMGIYLAFGWVILDDVIQRPVIDDWRFLTDYIIKACMWVAIAWSMFIQDGVERYRKGGV